MITDYKGVIDPQKWLDFPDEDGYGVDGILLGRLAKLAEDNGKKIEVIDGYRDYDEQNTLYNKYLNGTGNLAAKPGSSNHERGLAVDVSGWVKSLSESKMNEYGLTKPVEGENWHIELLETRENNYTTALGTTSYLTNERDYYPGLSVVDRSLPVDSVVEQLYQLEKFEGGITNVSPIALVANNGTTILFRFVVILLGLIILLVSLSKLI